MLSESPRQRSEKFVPAVSKEHIINLENLDDWEQKIFEKIQKVKNKNVTMVYRGDNPLLMAVESIYKQAGFKVQTIKFEPEFDPDRCGVNEMHKMYLEFSKIMNDFPHIITDNTMNSVIEIHAKKTPIDAHKSLYSSNIDHFVSKYKSAIEKFKNKNPILLEWKISDHVGFSCFPMSELKYLGFNIESRDEINEAKVIEKVFREYGNDRDEVERQNNIRRDKIKKMLNKAIAQIFAEMFGIPSLKLAELDNFQYRKYDNPAREVRKIIENNLPNQKDILILHDHHVPIEVSDRFTKQLICPCHCQIGREDIYKNAGRRDAFTVIDNINIAME